MDVTEAIISSVVLILLLIPVFIVGRRRGQRNLQAIRSAIEEVMSEVASEVYGIDVTGYRIWGIDRWFSRWSTTAETSRHLVVMRFWQTAKQTFSLEQITVLEKR